MLADDVVDAYPISVLQMGMLHHMDMSNGEESPADYHNLTTFRGRIKGAFDKTLFQESINIIVKEHDNLRTTFDLTNFSIPLQLVHREASLEMGYDDLRGLSEAEQEAEISRYIELENKNMFDITQAPLMRFHVHQIEDDVISLSFTEPHSVSDGWSTHLTVMDIFDIYFALQRGQTFSLPEPALKYSDFIHEELKILKSQEAIDFWDAKLKECVNTELPFLEKEVATQEVDIYSHKYPFKLPRDIVKQLHEVVKKTGVPFKGILLAIHFKFLSIVTGQSNVTTGLAFNGRLEAENSEQMRGMFLNTLPVSMDLSAGSWRDLILASHQSELELVPFRRYPFGAIQKKYGTQPVFHTHLGFLHFHSMADKVAEGNVEKISNVDLSKTNFDLSTVFCMDPSDKYNIEFLGEVNLNKVSKSQFVSYMEVYVRLMKDLVENLDNPHASSCFLSNDEKEKQLVLWNQHEQEYDRTLHIHTMVERCAELYHDKIAAKYDDESITYGELNTRANQLAYCLVELGLKNNELVGICLERSVESLIAMTAILKAGGAYLPLDPDYPQERLEYMFEDTQLNLVISTKTLQSKLPANSHTMICLDSFGEEKWDLQHLSTLPSSNLHHSELLPSEQQLAYVIYTSGSTGKPKGVAVTHNNVVSLVEDNKNIEVLPSDVMAQASNAAFDAATYEFWGALTKGAMICGVNKTTLLSPELLKAQIEQDKITVMFVTTALFNRIADEQPDTFQTLRKVLFGGEAHSLKAIGNILLGKSPQQLVHVYGPTETTTFATAFKFDCNEFRRYASAPIGKPLSNHKCYVLNPQLEPVPVGSVGELYIGGDGVACGYWQREALTDERFIPNPFNHSGAATLYKTGDTVRYLSDGNIEFVGRVDNQVKIRGFRIELDELSTTLQSCPILKDSTVIVREDEPGDKKLVGYIVYRDDSESNLDEVIKYLKSKLPSYMVPTLFEELESIPLTVNGKVDKKSLPKPTLTGQNQSHFEAPRNTNEKILCEIWQEILGLEKVGIHDNFFTCGGDSIISIQLVSKANRQGISINTRDIFEAQTIAELAKKCAENDTVSASKVSSGKLTLHPIQANFFSTQHTDHNHFHQSACLSVPTDFDIKFLDEFVSALYQRHDVLRLTFAKQDEKWQGKFAHMDTDKLSQVVKQVNLDTRDGELATRYEEIGFEFKSSFDISSGPLLNIVYIDSQEPENRRLLIIIHHLIVDGVSWRILLEDLNSAYQQYLADGSVSLTASGTSYKDYAAMLSNQDSQQRFESEKQYWLHQLQNGDLVLPYQDTDSSDTYADAANQEVVVDAKTTQSLLGQSNAPFKTKVNELLLSALALAFNRWCGSTAINVTLEGHGREEFHENVSLSQTMGWFTSMYPVLLSHQDCKASGGLGNLICSVKEQLRKVPNNGIGFGALSYIFDDQDIKRACEQHENSILFNYLGQFDQQAGEQALFKGAGDFTGADISAQHTRSHLLDINGMVFNGELKFQVNYHAEKFDNADIKKFCSFFESALMEVSAYCEQPNVERLTPADFPLCQLSQGELDTLQSRYTNIAELYPVTSMQAGLIYHGLLNTEKDSYINQLNIEFKGKFEIELFKKAWLAVIQRHNILRTAFVGLDRETPLQLVSESIQMDWTHLDWSAKSATEVEHEFADLLQEDKQQGFDFSVPGLMRFFTIKVNATCYKFAWTHHHTLIDGWSQPILFGEVFSAYQAFAANQLPEFVGEANYKEYIKWCVEQPLDEAKQFWSEHLKTLESPTQLGIEKREGDDTSVAIAEQRKSLTTDLTSQLKKVAGEAQVTLNTLVQAAWGYLLHRYSGNDEVIFGETVSGRNVEVDNVDKMVGLFIKTLPSVVSFTNDTRVDQWLKGLHENQNKRDKFSYLSLTQIKECSQFDPIAPLFDVAMVFENYPIADAPELGQQESEFEISDFNAKAHAHFGMSLIVAPGEALTFELNYSEQKYEAHYVQTLLDHLETVLAGIVNNLTANVSELPLLTATELDAMVISSDNAAETVPGMTVHSWFEQQVAQYPTRPALQLHDEVMSYQALNIAANRFAGYLQAQGVNAQSKVIIHCERSFEMIVAVLAVLKAGASYVPLDVSYPVERKDYVINDSGAAVIITHSALEETLPTHSCDVVSVDNLSELTAAYSECNTVSEHTGAKPNDLAYVIYTSGSTGNPKGVLIEHASMLNLARQQTGLFAVDQQSRVLQFASLSFDAAAWELLMALCNGACLCLIDAHTLMNPDLMAQYLSDQEITHATLPPALLVNLASEQFSQLETLIVAGEAISKEQAIIWSEGRKLFNAYGPTENTVCISVGEITTENVHIGRPIGNVECFILDAYQRPVPAGCVGELYVGGRGLARSYLNLPEVTAEKFLTLPTNVVGSNTERVYRTGDLVRLNLEGNLEFIGRVDSQVKIRGFRVELGEIESVINSFDFIANSAVLLAQGESHDNRLIAFIETTEALTNAADDVFTLLEAKLPSYMLPSTINVLEALPLNHNGKVDRKALSQKIQSEPSTLEYEAPKFEIEAQLIALWQSLLNKRNIGIKDNFFKLGGNSLLAMRLREKIVQELEIEVSVTDIFNYPTVEQLAGFILHEHKDNPLVNTALIQFTEEGSGNVPIAVVGMSTRFGNTQNFEEFWSLLESGHEAIEELTDEQLRAAGISEKLIGNPEYIRKTFRFQGMEMFDAEFFEFSERQAEMTDPQHRVLLECAYEAMEIAGYPSEPESGSVGVFVGKSDNIGWIQKMMSQSHGHNAVDGMEAMKASSGAFLSTQLSYNLNLTGPSVNINTACSTSLVAVHQACKSIQNGECTMALAGGVSISAMEPAGYVHQEGFITSKDGHCRPFDESASGTRVGQGAGMVLLKRLDLAIEDGDTIFAVVKGSAINNDGSLKPGYTAPSVEGQAKAIASAMTVAGVEPSTIGFVEAHGTGTYLGDPIEVRALNRAYKSVAGKELDKQSIALGTLKANIGHLDTAAGVAGFIHAVCALNYKKISPNINFNSPNPELDLQSTPFYLENELREWKGGVEPRRGAVSSFGIGGTNAHVILEEFEGSGEDRSRMKYHVLPLSAKSPEALIASKGRLSAYINSHADIDVANMAYTLQQGRKPYQYRDALVVTSASEATELLQTTAQKVHRAASRELTFMFPGQGAQYTGMLLSLYQSSDEFKQQLDECIALFNPYLDSDLYAVCFDPEKERLLDQTNYTQAALFSIEYALARHLMTLGIKPSAMIGHSIGEYVAACLAGVFSLEDAIHIVANRGRLMQSMPTGNMVAIKCTAQQANEIAAQFNLCVAATNAKESIVLSGDSDSISRCLASLEANSIKYKKLKGDRAFHSRHTHSILMEFESVFDGVSLHAPALPFISNVSGDWITPDQAMTAQYWVEQLAGEVRFASGIESLINRYPEHALLEVGPGKTLAGLVSMHLPDLIESVVPFVSLADNHSEGEELVANVMAKLWSIGAHIDWSVCYRGEKRRRIPLPTYAFQRKRFEPQIRQEMHSATTNQNNKLDFSKWFYAPNWLRKPNQPSQVDGHRCLYIHDAKHDPSLHIAQLTRANVEVVQAMGAQATRQISDSTFEVNLASEQGMVALFTLLEEQHFDHIVMPLGFSTQASSAMLSYEARLQNDFYPAFFMFKALAEIHRSDLKVTLLTAEAFEVVGYENNNAIAAMLPALCKSATAELVNIDAGVVDIENTQASFSHSWVDELGRVFSNDRIVALRGKNRYVETYSQVDVSSSASNLSQVKENGTYIIIGGLGGMGLAVAEELVSKASVNLVLTTRTQSTIADLRTRLEPQAYQRLQDINNSAMSCQISALDVADNQAFEAFVTDCIATTGTIDGIVYCAGVPGADKPIAELDIAELQAVMASKVSGLINLEMVIKRHELQPNFITLMSSLQTVVDTHKNRVDYGAANSFVDNFIAQLSETIPTCQIQVINWNTWSESGMAVNAVSEQSLEVNIAEKVVNSISNSEGRRVFATALNSGYQRIAICATDLSELKNLEKQALKKAHPKQEQQLTSDEAAEIFDSILFDILGCQEVDLRQNFHALGGDSLAAIRLNAQFAERLGVDISMAEIMESQSMLSLFDSINQKLGDSVQKRQTIASVEKLYGPLTFAQQRLWFIDEMEGGSSAYNQAWAIKLTGELNTVAMENAIKSVIERHTILRTTYHQGDEAFQQINENFEFELALVDISNVNKAQRDDEIERIINEEQRLPFVLSQDLMVRSKLLRLGQTEHVLLFSQHHICTDGFSMSRLFEELSFYYNGFLSDNKPALPALPIQYMDYAYWQREHMQGETFAAELESVCERLRGAPQVHSLPLDFQRPNQQSYRGDKWISNLDNTLSKKLHALAKSTNTTLFMVMNSALSILISKLGTENDVVIGTPVANRGEQETMPLIGFFVNTMAIRTQVDVEQSFTELLTQVKEECLHTYENQHIPFELVVEKINPERSLGYHPLVQILLVVQDKNVGDLQLNNLDIERMLPSEAYSKFDLSVNVTDHDDGIEVCWEYAKDLFAESSMARFTKHFITLLNNIVENQSLPIAELSLISPEEQVELLSFAQGEVIELSKEPTIHALFEQQVQKTPEATAVSYDDDTLTYAELNNRANQLASYLKQKGVGENKYVALYMDRSVELVVAIWAVLKAGGAYIPLDVSTPSERLATILMDSQPVCILTQQHLYDLVAPCSALPVIALNEQSLQAELMSYTTVNQSINSQSPDSCAYVIYTSGSTGTPKGVVCTHRGLINRIDWMQNEFKLHQSDVVLQKTPYSFDVSVWEFVWPLTSGAKLVVMRPEEHKDPEQIRQLIQAKQVTTLHFVPSMLNAMLSADAWHGCDSVARVICSGEALPIELQNTFYSKAKQASLHNLYGPTEASIDVSFWHCPNDTSAKTVPIGKPIQNTQLIILDEHQRLVPHGVVGELYIGGVGLAREYLNRPELTASTFIANPYSSLNTQRLYKSGDLAYVNQQGQIEYVGRIDDQVKIRGLRIELGEIEYHLNNIEQISKTTVLARQDLSGNTRLVAYYSVVGDAELTNEQLHQALVAVLPEYMVPATFVLMEQWPLTVSGKVDKKQLPNPVMQTASEYLAPQTDVEKVLSSIWEELLGIAKVGIKDNFFSLGGDSILSTQVVARAKRAGLTFTIKDMFNYQTIQELAPVVMSNAAIDIPQEAVVGEQLLTPIQKQFVEKRLANPNHYNQAVLLNAPEGMQLSELETIAKSVISRHDVLRLKFGLEQNQYCYIPESDIDISTVVQEVSFTEIADSEQAKAIELFCGGLQESLNISSGETFKLALIHLGNGRLKLFILGHHLIIDGVSWRIIMADLEQAWEDLKSGNDVLLSAKTTSYQFWGQTLSDYACSDDLLSQREYWIDQLSKYEQHNIECLADTQDSIISTASLAVSEENTAQLVDSANSAYRTKVHELIIAAVFSAFRQWSGAETIRVDIEGHGRENIADGIDLSDTVGWFTSIYPLMLNAPMNEPVGELIKLVKDSYRGVPDNGIGFGALRYLANDHEIQALDESTSSYNVVFNYLGQFDNIASAKSAFSFAEEKTGLSSSAENKIDDFITVNALIYQGRLKVDISSIKVGEAQLAQLLSYLEQSIETVLLACHSKLAEQEMIAEYNELAHSLPKQVEAIEI
ncbi:non-ribosomal peptide synthetase/type I polyketide synthase [Pseudoalteromonas sp. PS5]|uniref:non-ribosomal peptide synthetase/type I polyketide synthase n=1 Tax=Pseudoalteromonas sp. PS5 TaxID=1437473 RepID=UPI000FFF4F8C|nr:non-ribosomal peptide synthetase/type I polyketide synthase [Pseudoalteromonas sp. PS5]RXF01352.1 amino acid adenylation domain-containing protein [Pseudoalteromonas sp. PS5]